MDNNSKRFSKLTLTERIHYLLEEGLITTEESEKLLAGSFLSSSLAENLIENAVGYYQIPLGIAVNFIIDNKPYVIPMAIEESSVIAAASKTAKWIAEHGEIETAIDGQCYIGQIHFEPVKNPRQFKAQINAKKNQLIDDLNNTIASNMYKRGGGINDILVRKLKSNNGNHYVSLHVHVNTCDAMGANVINQICEYLKEPVEQITHERVAFCILSNFTDTKLTTVRIKLNNIDIHLAKAIELASYIGGIDPYRAVTNNKGIMNGMDAVLLATGNDWRSVEAAIHAYSVRDQQYRSLAQWVVENNCLIGKLQAPINVGIVGGVTSIHPTAKLSLKILNVNSANELSRVIGAVGLVQNLGALRALVSEGICKGHMKLHLANLCMMHGCSPEMMEEIKSQLEDDIANNGYIASDKIKALLNKQKRSDKNE